MTNRQAGEISAQNCYIDKILDLQGCLSRQRLGFQVGWVVTKSLESTVGIWT